MLEETETYIRARADINFGYIFLGGLFLLLIVTAQYLINCFFASLGESTLVQIMLMGCGLAIMAMCVFSPLIYATGAYDIINDTYVNSVPYIAWSFGPVNFMGCYIEFFNNPIIGQDFVWADQYGQYLIGLFIGLGAAGGAGTYLALSGEPSGEFAGHWKPRNIYISILPHAAALAIGIALAMGVGAITGLLTAIGSYSLVMLYAVAYYALLSLMRKSFKPSKTDLIIYLGVVTFVLAATIAMTALAVGFAAN